ncbi:hypothetical protein HRbin04_00833 [archaeon HR04]|nr:hypothetical protein HRbin04_00833 [archaeon HR04]
MAALLVPLLLIGGSNAFGFGDGPEEEITPGDPSEVPPEGPTPPSPPPEPEDELCDRPGPPPIDPIICSGEPPILLENDAAVKAYHTSGTLVTNADPLMLGEDVDCVAGIDLAAVPLPGNEVEMVCYILPPGSDPTRECCIGKAFIINTYTMPPRALCDGSVLLCALGW